VPSPISNSWTLTKLLQNTYRYQRNRFKYKLRDYVRALHIQQIKVYDGKNPGEARTKFIINTRSTPQYSPYYTKLDRWGRKRTRQAKYKHMYSVTIQLDELSMHVPFKGRVGALGKWDFTPRGRPKKVNGLIVEGTNYRRGINADWWFRCSWVWKNEGIIFGQNYANGPPVKVNPYKICFAPKHFIAAVDLCMKYGILAK
jgi:hypothetical protein